MVICRLTQNLAERRQICRLLAQRQLSQVTAARIRCFVFVVLWFVLCNIAYISVVLIM